MSEREKLRLAVCHAADIRPSDADAVIRLVVEACIIELVENSVQPFAAAVLHNTFLPTTKDPKP